MLRLLDESRCVMMLFYLSDLRLYIFRNIHSIRDRNHVADVVEAAPSLLSSRGCLQRATGWNLLDRQREVLILYLKRAGDPAAQ